MELKNPLGPPTTAGAKPESSIANPQGPEATAGPMPAAEGGANSALQEAEPGKVQADAHRIVTRGMEILHSPQTKDAILQSMRVSNDPVQAMADKGKEIMQRVDTAARQEGTEINVMAKINGGRELVNEIADLAESAGAPPVSEEDRELAWSVSMQDYMKDEIAAGRLDPKEVEQGVMESMKSLDKEQLEAANQEMIRLDTTAQKRKETMAGQQQAPQPQTDQGVV